MNKKDQIRPIRQICLIWQIGLIGLICLISPIGVFAEDYSSPNFKLKNTNLGEQPFLTAKDVSPPNVTGPGPEVISLEPRTVKIKWFTDKPANTVVAFSTIAGQHSREISLSTEYITTHEIELTGLDPKTTYYYIAKSVDLYGNPGVSTERSFTTPLPVPKVINLKAEKIESGKATISFESDYFTTAVVEYINLDNLDKKTVGETNFSKAHKIEITGLDDNRSYSYRVIVRDEEGNESTSSTQTFKTRKDGSPPVLSSTKFDVNPIAGRELARIIISWKTDEPASSQIIYSENGQGNDEKTPEDDTLTTNHIVTLVNLKPQMTYRLWAISADKAGNAGRTDGRVPDPDSPPAPHHFSTDP